MEEVRNMKINDAFVTEGVIRPDGLLEHDMYIVQVKTPAESKSDWDFYKVLKTMKGEEAFGKLADSTCPLVKK
jgi:branched-chain amino acid transport system substrate-binding protein